MKLSNNKNDISCVDVYGFDIQIIDATSNGTTTEYNRVLVLTMHPLNMDDNKLPSSLYANYSKFELLCHVPEFNINERG